MTIQTQTTSANLREFILTLPVAQPIQADSRDYGFDFNEDELGRELLASLAISNSTPSSLEEALVAFEKASHHFLS